MKAGIGKGRTAVSASGLRVKVVGRADAVRAMRRWLTDKSPIPVTFELARRRRSTVVIRVEPLHAKRAGGWVIDRAAYILNIGDIALDVPRSPLYIPCQRDTG